MQKTLALVIRKQNLGETDRIITVLTPSLGKRRVVARSIRRPLSKMAGHLDTFMVAQIILTEKAELPTVTSAVLVESFSQLRSNYEDITRANKVSQLLEKAMMEDLPQQSLFRLAVDTLVRINGQYNWTRTWLYFLSKLAGELSVLTNRFQCATCQNTLKDGGYYQYIDHRFYCNEHALVSGQLLSANAIKLLQLLQKNNFTVISKIIVPLEVAQEVEELLLKEITQVINKPWDWYACLDRS